MVKKGKCLSLNNGKRGIIKLRHLPFLTIYNYKFYRYIYFTCTLYVNSVGSHIVRT